MDLVQERISIDFKTDVDPQVFSLKPAGQYRYRLVFDIYPSVDLPVCIQYIGGSGINLYPYIIRH